MALGLSACILGTSLYVTNPCDHSVELKLSRDDVDTPRERDWRVAKGYPVSIAVVAAGGTAHLGELDTAEGPEEGFILWYDEAEYQQFITFEEVQDTDEPYVLPDWVCRS